MNTLFIRTALLAAALGFMSGGVAFAQESGSSKDQAQQQTDQEQMKQAGQGKDQQAGQEQMKQAGQGKDQQADQEKMKQADQGNKQSGQMGGNNAGNKNNPKSQDKAKAQETKTGKTSGGMNGNMLEVDDLIGATVTNKNDEGIGNIDNLLMTQDGQVKKAVISVGGFLGIGDKQVALALDKLDIQPMQKGGGLTVQYSGTTDELENAPAYEPKKESGKNSSAGGGNAQSGSGSSGSGSQGGQQQSQ